MMESIKAWSLTVQKEALPGQAILLLSIKEENHSSNFSQPTESNLF